MTLQPDGQIIFCDGEDCDAAALATNSKVSIRPSLDPRSGLNWLVVVRDKGTFHYCPTCAPRRVAAIYGASLPNINSQSRVSGKGYFRHHHASPHLAH